jgi:uncharacterized protein
MKYDILGDLRRGDGRVTVEVDGPPPEGTGLRVLAPILGRIVLTNTGSVVTAQGEVRARLVMECGRCLKIHEVAITIPVNEICSLTQIDQPMAEETAEDAPIPILDGGSVDLSELLRQLLTLHAPPRSLCRPDCPGLCPVCGRDLGNGPCACSKDNIDPRLAGLRDLLP